MAEQGPHKAIERVAFSWKCKHCRRVLPAGSEVLFYPDPLQKDGQWVSCVPCGRAYADVIKGPKAAGS